MISMQIEFTGTVEKMRSSFVKIVNDAMKQVVRGWHRVALPKHFQSGAEKRYRYTPRTARYIKRKQRKGVTAPLVWTGRSRRQLTQVIRPTGTRMLVKGKFVTDSTMRYFWMTGSGQPNKGDELIRTIRSEEKQIAKAVEKLTLEQLNRINDKKRVK